MSETFHTAANVIPTTAPIDSTSVVRRSAV